MPTSSRRLISRLGLAVGLAVVATTPAKATLTGPVLSPASPRAFELSPIAPRTPISLADGIRDWRGALSHIAGSAHYDRGEWIYEDFPYTAYGAALPAVAQSYEGLDVLAGEVPASQRLPGGSEEAAATVGAGPLVDEADLSQLRVALRGSSVYVLARTTAMRAPVRTAVLLLFDTGRGGGISRPVPFGSGLTTTQGDTAVLFTAAGARIIDLVSGKTTDAPSTADPTGYINSLEARLPFALVRSTRTDELRLVAAAGLVARGSYTLDPGGVEGPIDKVVPRFREPVQAVPERLQALALAHKNIDQFFTTISVSRLRAGARQRLAPGIGYTVRTITAPASISQEKGTDGTLRDYGLYIPSGFTNRPTPATVLLRGSGETAHSLAAVTPALFQQLGDSNHAIVISPGGRSAGDLFERAAYLDAQQEISDAEHQLPIDPNRLTVAGYSMGGFATYMFAETQPDRYAAAFVIEGPVGGAQPSTFETVINSIPDVVPSLSNLFLTPIEIYQGTNDADVPASNALASSGRLRELGYRYRLNVFPGDHFTPGAFNDYAIGADYLKGKARDAHPAKVRLTRNMPFEHAIDTGEFSDEPLPGHSVGLRFDHAWWVSDLQPTDPHTGVATIDAKTFARPQSTITPVHTVGNDPASPGGAPPSAFDQQDWMTGAAVVRRNAFEASLTHVAHVTLDLAGMGLTLHRPLDATIISDTPTDVLLRPRKPECVAVSMDRGRSSRSRRLARIRLALTAGTHHLHVQTTRCSTRHRKV